MCVRFEHVGSVKFEFGTFLQLLSTFVIFLENPPKNSSWISSILTISVIIDSVALVKRLTFFENFSVFSQFGFAFIAVCFAPNFLVTLTHPEITPYNSVATFGVTPPYAQYVISSQMRTTILYFHLSLCSHHAHASVYLSETIAPSGQLDYMHFCKSGPVRSGLGELI